MAMYHQYRDLPQIPSFPDDSQYAAWMHDPMGYRYHPAHAENGFDYNTMDNSGTMRMQAVQRFLTDASPLTCGFLHAKLDRGMPMQSPHYGQYEQWPRADIGRYDSPDRTSVSGNSSYATQNEVRSPPYYSAANNSPEQFARPSYSYPGAERMEETSPSLQVPLTGGSISLRELEYEHESEPEPEPAVQEAEAIEMKTDATSEHESVYMKTDATSEHESSYMKMDVTSDSYQNCSDSGVGSSVRDAESVQPMDLSAGESSDADYTPKRSNKRRRSSASNSKAIRTGQRRRSYTGRKSASASTSNGNKVNKRNGRVTTSSSVAKVSTETQISCDAQRHFPCPLATYGCYSTFSSKNEWKRHVSTQHIKLGFWRCKLCTASIDPNIEKTIYHNDFNRKDLFTQHLRRMHAAPSNQSIRNQKHFPVTDENIAHHQKHCFRVLRSTPTQSCCLYCDETFSGPTSWENRMEHIGRHLEKDRKTGLKLDDVASWNVDKDLEQWLLNEGVIALDKSGRFKIGDGIPKRRSTSSDVESEEEG